MEAGGRNKKICRICRAGGGVCRQGLRKTHERADPECRFHGSDARGNTAVARGDVTRGADQAAPRGEGSGEAARPRQHVPFEQMTKFVTKGGIGLHYLPWTGWQQHTYTCGPEAQLGGAKATHAKQEPKKKDSRTTGGKSSTTSTRPHESQPPET